MDQEEILFEDHPKMFRNRPITFILCLGLVLLYGLGLIPLLIWYIKVKGIKLKITDKRIELRKGIIRKKTNEIIKKDIRNITTSQSVTQRLTGVGHLTISSAATGGVEISVSGFKNPEKLKKLIRQ
ncbi:PH domain-containing protein [Halarsenatibacter silvermanii]|uniref:PH domain-containing protein n=1 Tax=Halarsenatibacter silvermanii TaxID=321763 RepID=A0A1G9SKX0_9FIRM|nr:PH domain-containing protein [Halarsenatibacter silvermanii]SDM36071.1 PH domain-containing protein [Halarsenatibacter silvermanii]